MSIKIKLLSIFIFTIAFGIVNAQQFPLYTQYMFNPYSVNPAFVASNGRSEINTSYRQQWSGFKDGPKTLQFDIQHPINNKMAIGLYVSNDKTILLSSSSVMATYGYRVLLATDHILSFGLSAGFFSNQIKLENVPDIDLSDPALLNATNNNFSFDGRFGVSYTFKGLAVGFSLNNLVDRKSFSEDKLQNVTFSELKNRIALISYKFPIGESFSFQPNFLYHFTRDDLNFYEASGLFEFKQIIGVGGGYRQDFGALAYLRLSIKNLQIGYAYDFPAVQSGVSTGGSNEVQLKWSFGRQVEKLTKSTKKKKAPTPEPEVVSPVITRTDSSQTVKAEQNKVEEPLPQEPQLVNAPEPQPKQDENQDNTDAPWHLIIGTFEKKSNAEKLVRSLAKNGFDAEIKISPDNQYYYVHLPKYKTQEITLEKVLEIRNTTHIKDAWFKKME